MAKQMYRVQGDFSLMINWSRFFGNEQKHSQEESVLQRQKDAKKPPVMTTMLAAWVTFWVAVFNYSQIGAVITLGVCAAIPLFMNRHELTLYDKLSIAFTSWLSFIWYDVAYILLYKGTVMCMLCKI